MNVKNCHKCGKLFNYVSGQPVCPACREALENKFQEVKKYIQENRDTSVRSVAEACEIDESQIRQWVREERLVFSDGAMTGIVCETCGSPISTGRFCEKCKASMINTFSSAGRQRPQPVKQETGRKSTETKMRFLNK